MSKLLDQAERRGFVVLTPETRGNVLYTGKAERGVLEAIEVLAKDMAVDRDAIRLTGVSMGGAGALQLRLPLPDRFASIVAFYGDSRYDRASYVGKILRTQAEADRYSVLLFPENVRSLPVLLVHAQDDAVSPFMESKQLFEASREAGLGVEAWHARGRAHPRDVRGPRARGRRVVRAKEGGAATTVTFRASRRLRAGLLARGGARKGGRLRRRRCLPRGRQGARESRRGGSPRARWILAAAGLTALVLEGKPIVPVVARYNPDADEGPGDHPNRRPGGVGGRRAAVVEAHAAPRPLGLGVGVGRDQHPHRRPEHDRGGLEHRQGDHHAEAASP